MPRRLLAWGNNVARALDPTSEEPLLPAPVDITKATGCDEVVFHSWACTIGRDRMSGKLFAWGIHPLIPDGIISSLDMPTPRKVLGVGQPAGFLMPDGTIRDLAGRSSSRTCQDVVMTEQGDTYTFQDLLETAAGTPLAHPLLPLSNLELYATESRAFVLARGVMPLLFEIHTLEGHKPCPPRLEVVSGLEGVGIKSIVPGSSNRLGVVSDAGEAWILGRRGEPELQEIDGDIEFLGLGSAFEVVVTDAAAWVRDDFGQLGISDQDTTEDWVGLSGLSGRIVDVVSARWSTFVTVEDDSDNELQQGR
ncbi:hypothetical protein EHS25_009684 [Saitozyma podzolica]|uniref:Uncharacterized protein n=1 Tax=Saitozyma podzolica TaxID=1890683 RepID=A0A427YJW7_9TREE|nr:hypothetical protein EHS25_009684 [Saitozyma podzolica]